MTTVDYTFSPQARLRQKQEYQVVFQSAECRSSDAQLTLIARKNGLEHPRLGLAVGKRAAQSAVVRNRLKRQIRESFRHHQHQLGGLDIVVLGRDRAGTCDNPALRKSLQAHWQRVISQCANY